MSAGDAEWDRLIHRHLSGTLTEEESRAFAEALRNEPRVRRRLAEMAFDEAGLRQIFGGAPAAPAAPAEPPRARWPRGPLVAAAAILGATLVALMAAFLRGGPVHPVVAGEVRADGAPVRDVPEGKRIEVAGLDPAEIALADGSRVTLEPGSAAVLRRRSVELARGTGRFRVAEGEGPFVVDTPFGKITVLGTEFSVELARSPKLRVRVTSGLVQVEAEGRTQVLKGGEAEDFPRVKETKKDLPPGGVVRIRGTVVNVTEAGLELQVEEVEGDGGDEPALVGKVVRVGPGMEADREGPSKTHVLFLRKHRKGDTSRLIVRPGAGGKGYVLGELSPEQAAWALEPVRKPDEGKRKKDPEKKRPTEGTEDGDR